MLSMGVGEIQKNSSIFSNISESIQIVDKRRKRVLAMVYPVKATSVIDKLAGKYKNKIKKSDLSIDEIKTLAMQEAMEEKYGKSN